MQLFTLLAASHATTLIPKSAQDLVREAELIFEGVVAAVEYRNSDVESPDQVALPHTFVTFDIDRRLKGTSEAGNTITLRLEGGPDGEGHYLFIPGMPRFDPGERVILFVRGNSRHPCPLVGWEQGRFRVVGDEVFNESGQEVWLTGDGGFAFGPLHDLEEARLHRMGELELVRETGEEPSVGLPPGGTVRLDAASFADAITALVGELHDPDRLAALPPAASVSIFEPFTAPKLTPVKFPPPIENVEEELRGLGEPDELEAELLRRSGGDPTLPTPQP